MITIYLIDDQNIYVGSQKVDPFGPLPPGAVLTAPPFLAAGTYGLWEAGEWKVVENRPARVAAPAPDPIQSAPDEVTMRQAQQALLAAGLLDDVPALIDAIPDPVERRFAQIEWDKSQTVKRQRHLTQRIAEGLGLTPSQMADLFTYASSIP